MSVPDHDYNSYLLGEWRLFSENEQRQQQAVDGAAGISIHDVLDVGCGGGQEMIPFGRLGATCVGIDISPESGAFGRQMFGAHHPGMRVHFATAGAERLPFADEAFDLVLCRVAIPYTDNRQALQEMARVLRPGGVLLLKTHHARYYIRKALDGLRQGSPLFTLHALRVLLSGALFQVFGRQPAGGMLLRETYLTAGMLNRELRRAGMSIDGELPDSNPRTPSYRIRKRSNRR
jgi:SAM-dependent methyltransferase